MKKQLKQMEGYIYGAIISSIIVSLTQHDLALFFFLIVVHSGVMILILKIIERYE